MIELRCTKCSEKIVYSKENLKDKYIFCSSCREKYPLIGASPYMGFFTKEDIIGLFEISAVSKNSKTMQGIDFALWERVCSAFHETGDEFAVRAELKDAFVYFPFRYNEWLLLRGLLAIIDLNGKTVLDVGAGVGFDAWRLVQRGGLVTALEYNPSLLSIGQKNLPEATWIGGFSHLLPFLTGSFDLVVCNAALHHMRDIPGAMEEFLRVLKPGGIMLTACDSFSSDAHSEKAMLKTFNSVPEVLLGVNEQAPRAREFLTCLKNNRDALDVELFTTMTYDYSDGLGIPLTYYARWDFDSAIKTLGSLSGSLAIRARRSGRFSLSPRIQTDGWLAADVFMDMCQDSQEATTFLARHIPERFVNLPLPLPFHDKFLQVNGWRCEYENEDGWQEAYGRVNMFMRISTCKSLLEFELEALNTGDIEEAPISISINGKMLVSESIVRGTWHRIRLSLKDVSLDETFVVTICVNGHDKFDSRLFRIRNVSFKDEDSLSSVKVLCQGTTAGIAALVATRFKNKEYINVLCLPGQLNLFRSLGHLRACGKATMRLLVPENMAWLFAAETGVDRVDTYPVNTIGITKALATHELPDIVLMPINITLHAPWLDHIMTLRLPIIDGSSGRLISKLVTTEQKHIFFPYLFKQRIKAKIPTPIMKVLRFVKSKIC
ncbi:MAG: class I SAM-dependent methyltransferase [Desulfomicrobium sp.]|nr:class I SAM-dependent methyltransferase [Desulfomicrobium sp.]